MDEKETFDDLPDTPGTQADASEAAENDPVAGEDRPAKASKKSGIGTKLLLGAVVLAGLGAVIVPRMVGNPGQDGVLGVLTEGFANLTGSAAVDAADRTDGAAASPTPGDPVGDMAVPATSDVSDGASSDVTETQLSLATENGAADAAETVSTDDASAAEASSPSNDPKTNFSESDVTTAAENGVENAEDQAVEIADSDATTTDKIVDENTDQLIAENNAEEAGAGFVENTGENPTRTETSTDKPDTQESTTEAPSTIEIAALSAENQSLQARIASLEGELSTAQAAADANITNSGVADLRLRLARGDDIGGVIDDLAAQGIELPEILLSAGDGTPTLAQLRDEFPGAAHSALRATIRASKGDRWYDGALSLINAEFAGRSLTPQEGNSPDAVLSRIGAAVEAGDLEAAISESGLLPSEAKAALGDWTAKLQQRLTVETAIEELAQNTNRG